MKRFCADLRYAAKVNDCEEKEMMPLTKKQEKKYKKQKCCHICEEELNENGSGRKQ